jgi:hypothetical protein
MRSGRRRKDILTVIREFAQDFHKQSLGSEHAEVERLNVEKRGRAGVAVRRRAGA